MPVAWQGRSSWLVGLASSPLIFEELGFRGRSAKDHVQLSLTQLSYAERWSIPEKTKAKSVWDKEWIDNIPGQRGAASDSATAEMGPSCCFCFFSLCVCMFTCKQVCAHVCACSHASRYMHVCACSHASRCMTMCVHAPMQVGVCICSHASTGVCACVCMLTCKQVCVPVSRCMWRLQDDTGCLPQLFFTLFLRRSLPETRAHQVSWNGSQHIPSPGVAGVYYSACF